MNLWNFPRTLWFFRGGAGSELQKSASLTGTISASTDVNIDFIGTSVDIDLSTTYYVTISAQAVDEIEVDMSAFVYRATALFAQEVLVSIDVADGAFSSLDGKLSATPVYVLEQTGQFDTSISATYNATVSLTASIFPNVTVSVTFKATANPTAELLIADNISVSAQYLATASMSFILGVQQDTVEKSITGNYGITASTSFDLIKPSSGGLVYSQKKGRYIAVRVANAG